MLEKARARVLVFPEGFLGARRSAVLIEETAGDAPCTGAEARVERGNLAHDRAAGEAKALSEVGFCAPEIQALCADEATGEVQGVDDERERQLARFDEGAECPDGRVAEGAKGGEGGKHEEEHARGARKLGGVGHKSVSHIHSV